MAKGLERAWPLYLCGSKVAICVAVIATRCMLLKVMIIDK